MINICKYCYVVCILQARNFKIAFEAAESEDIPALLVSENILYTFTVLFTICFTHTEGIIVALGH